MLIGVVFHSYCDIVFQWTLNLSILKPIDFGVTSFREAFFSYHSAAGVLKNPFSSLIFLFFNTVGHFLLLETCCSLLGFWSTTLSCSLLPGSSVLLPVLVFLTKTSGGASRLTL